MPKQLFLPEHDGNIAEPPTPAIWHGYDRKILRTVSDGIVVGQSAVDRGISSVPDIWARPLAFQGALKPGSTHPLHRRVVQEWRGLLSLLALHKVHSYDVTFSSVQFRPGEFAKALSRLLPAPVALERGTPYHWTETIIVRFEGIPVGALSPTTLVYTGTDYNRRLAKKQLVLRDREGFLAPPKLGDDDLLAVGEWVEQLHDRLTGVGDPGNAILDIGTSAPVEKEVIRSIVGALDEWLSELRGGPDVRPGARLDSPEVEVDEDSVDVRPAAAFIDQRRVYRELLRPLRPSKRGDDVRRSDMLLTSKRNRSGRDHVIVITPRLLQTGGKIWDARRLSHLGGDAAKAVDTHFAGVSGQMVDRDDLKPANAMWIRPERYFLTDTLTVTTEKSPLLNPEWQALNGDRHFLLPFTKEILDFFDPNEIRDILKPEYKEADAGVTFVFSLPVNGKLERIQKTYRFKNAAVDEGTVVNFVVPVVELFPRYVDARWRRYYLIQSDPDDVIVDPIVGENCRVVARNYPRTANATSARAVEISGDGAFPEAILFARENVPLGVALVPKPDEPPGLSKHWRVGIDFGTSNTNVFKQNTEADTAERWRFDFDRYLLDVTMSDAARRNAVLEEFFVPPRAVELPVPTNLRVFQDARKEYPLLDYFIFFATKYELPRNVYSDIKWDDEEEQLTKYFLESLLFLILVEIGLARVKRVTLACSYPKAFSEDRLTRYKGEWDGVVRRLLEGDQCVFKRRDDHDTTGAEIFDPVFVSEGVAAGEFFASAKTIRKPEDVAKKEIAAVCLDVGGGTTDISIWFRNEIWFDASVLLAGRQISRLLQQNPRLLELLFSPRGAAALRQTDPSLEPKQFAGRLNVILKEEEDGVRDRLMDHGNNREVQWIRRILAVEFGAIAFYTASLIGAADRKLGGRLAERIADRGIALHWGGNAAKLINWIGLGRYDENGIASKMLNAAVFNALKDMKITAPSTGLAQKQSPGHKSEAAGGLVVMDLDHRRPRLSDGQTAGQDIEMPESDAEPGLTERGGVPLVCGEDIRLTDRSIDHRDEVSERSLFDRQGTTFESTSLSRLKRFVEIVNYFGVRFGLFTDDSKIMLSDARQGHIKDSILAHFVNAERTPEGKRIIEPVFIMEVKILLDLLKAELR